MINSSLLYAKTRQGQQIMVCHSPKNIWNNNSACDFSTILLKLVDLHTACFFLFQLFGIAKSCKHSNQKGHTLANSRIAPNVLCFKCQQNQVDFKFAWSNIVFFRWYKRSYGFLFNPTICYPLDWLNWKFSWDFDLFWSLNCRSLNILEIMRFSQPKCFGPVDSCLVQCESVSHWTKCPVEIFSSVDDCHRRATARNVEPCPVSPLRPGRMPHMIYILITNKFTY